MNALSAPACGSLPLLLPVLFLFACSGESEAPLPSEPRESSAPRSAREFVFDVETRIYGVKQETGEGPKYAFSAESLEREADDDTELVYEEGKPLLLKSTRVQLFHTGAEDIHFREFAEGSGVGTPPVRAYDFPEAARPQEIVNPLMALHPLAPLLPEFEGVISDGYEIQSREYREGTGQVMKSMNAG